MDLLGSYPGIPGLFVACVYSAALSTVSSGLNSLAAVCLKDFIQPFYKESNMSERYATNISKLLGKIFFNYRKTAYLRGRSNIRIFYFFLDFRSLPDFFFFLQKFENSVFIPGQISKKGLFFHIFLK